MRVTDDRYTGEMDKFELAIRMIGHEARTGTIRSCTGFTEDRIRKLYGTYFAADDDRADTPAPRQVAAPDRALRELLAAANGSDRTRMPVLVLRSLPSVDRPSSGAAGERGQGRARRADLSRVRGVSAPGARRTVFVRMDVEPVSRAGRNARTLLCVVRALFRSLRAGYVRTRLRALSDLRVQGPRRLIARADREGRGDGAMGRLCGKTDFGIVR